MARTLVIGGGSIGQRHSSILTRLGHENALVTSRPSQKGSTYQNLQEAMQLHQPNYVVISNSTCDHEGALKELANLGYSGKVLIEKPLQINPNTINRSSVERMNIGVAFNLRFHPIICDLKTFLSNEKVLTITVYAGQDLESWRPGRPLVEQYSGSRAGGGGVLRDLSHELDYILQLSGPIAKLVALGGRIGETKTIDADDCWSIIMSTTKVPQISLQLNYFDRPGARLIRVVTESETFVADLNAGSLSINNELIRNYTIERDETYERMHEDFFHSGGSTATVQDGITIDELINDIEISSLSNSWVSK